MLWCGTYERGFSLEKDSIFDGPLICHCHQYHWIFLYKVKVLTRFSSSSTWAIGFQPIYKPHLIFSDCNASLIYSSCMLLFHHSIPTSLFQLNVSQSDPFSSSIRENCSFKNVAVLQLLSASTSKRLVINLSPIYRMYIFALHQQFI